MHNTHMNGITMPVKATASFRKKHSDKPHIIYDSEDYIRDMHVEGLFNTLFHGLEITDTTRHNMRLYMDMHFGVAYDDIPDEFFESDQFAVAFIRASLGLLHVELIDNFEDPAFDHCTHQATLRTSLVPTTIYANAPSRLNAALLSVVSVLRRACDAHFTMLMQEGADDAD